MSLSKDQIDELQQDLINMKNDLKNSIEELDSVKDDTGELTSIDNHLADSTIGMVDREMQIAQNIDRREQLKEINDALKRIDDGTYGICIETGQPIPFERLKAIPYTKRLVEEEEKVNQLTPIEEQLNAKPQGHFEKPIGEVEDSKSATFEEAESHNEIERPKQMDQPIDGDVNDNHKLNKKNSL
ncbi:hypothetical protein GMB86_01180 [Terrilactibacillus sp. BCM23-1]|uniref:Zinc finger DksA/TraR C4-type domain-containing protein n=1 Tax=Terrilactibacillus tamarindi TaxID=2599694 RepID=A0A6N8CRM5_9BACI|nr:TraR/DksA C4-type zinc finger protein [Terrilactibacillus tamarindi]MTT30626.1 hypothetical protein [Terrilactibacillus tamarindi]